ncbi:MerR family transcriptional regulator [Gracilibacillus sp. S3-1-1]|uniref:MerR family transcriptional regulator n=1 Tax=Gracilibacillus pellucidus TaxID=3095368 RepID=A0ACC6M164_9BACI|nr:MerR family transcriptional regulator [Gracilibacillus sp. S3-1-1]MDX8044472.1 MerR family transcriptional regulator [Gracilibacillus sp. S3-1-1]
MNNKFSIGEMAKLHHTTVKTLRYYDQIGLLKPIEVDPKSGYRYYSTEQFEHLHTIHYLKELGFSLKEIKEHLENRNIDAFLTLIEKQKEWTEKKIDELQKLRRRFQHRINDITSARQVDQLGVVSIKKLHERKIVRLKETIRTERELELSLRHLENQAGLKSAIFIGGVGLTVSKDNIMAQQFHEYNSIFILVEEGTNSSVTTLLPSGQYACIYYNGNHDDSASYYQILLQYIEKHHFSIVGDAVERTIIDHYISGKREDYLTEIQIPIK